jgi:hypothetical protein
MATCDLYLKEFIFSSKYLGRFSILDLKIPSVKIAKTHSFTLSSNWGSLYLASSHAGVVHASVGQNS